MIKYIKTKGGYGVKYLKTPLALFLWMLLGSLIGIVVSTAISELYSFFNDIMPNLFPSYKVASGYKFFDTLYTSLWFISLLITVFITVYISLRYDNLKFEFIVSKTEGLYKIYDILPTYIGKFGISDLISAVFVGSVYTIPFIFVPIQFVKNESFLAKLAEPYKLMSECFGYVLAPIVLILSILLSYAATVPLALKYYRARWFSAFSEV